MPLQNLPGKSEHLHSSLAATSRQRATVPATRHYRSIRAITDSNQSINATYYYKAWGELAGSTGVVDTPFRWIGQFGYYHDSGNATLNIRQRVYRPSIGRWLSRDPLGIALPVLLNDYQYALSNPTNVIDPSGLFWIWPPLPPLIPATQVCNLLSRAVNSDLITCICGVASVADILSNLTGPLAPLIEAADCYCNMATSMSLFCSGQFTRTLFYALLTALDCGSTVLAVPGCELGAILGGGVAGVPGAILGCFSGAAAADPIVDVIAFGAQNYITQGTLLPLSQTKACCKLGGY